MTVVDANTLHLAAFTPYGTRHVAEASSPKASQPAAHTAPGGP
jgi:hypothetical protein